MFNKKISGNQAIGQEIILLANRLDWIHRNQGVTHFLLGSLDEDLSYLCQHLKNKLIKISDCDVELHCVDHETDCVPMISENKITLIYCNQISENPHLYNSLHLTEMGFLFVKSSGTNRGKLQQVLKFMDEIKTSIEGFIFYNHKSYVPKWFNRVLGR
jgi:hypothetical protein